MSSPLSSEHLERVCDAVRRLTKRAADHEDQLQRLVQAADAEVRDAQVAFRSARVTPADPATDWRGACSDRFNRSRDAADAARRACVSAREQHVATRRLLTELNEAHVDRQSVAPDYVAAVLVVDDVEDTRDLVALVLRQAGFLVRTAVNGVEALIAAYEMQPAVIVMDMMMPVLDGLEATRLIKATETTRSAKVIAYTANPTLPGVLVDRLFAAVLPKPSTPDVLLAAVQTVAGR